MARRASGAQSRNDLSGVGWQQVAGGAEPEEPGEAASPPPARLPSRPDCPRGQYFDEEQKELVCEPHTTASGYCCGERCPVCQRLVKDPVRHEGADARHGEPPPCGQLFCSECLYGWLNRQESGGDDPTCPMCRARIDDFPRSAPGPQGAPDAPFVPADAPGAVASPEIDDNDPWTPRLALLGIPVTTPDLLLPMHAPRLQLYYVSGQVYVPLDTLPPVGSTPVQALTHVHAILRMDIAALRGYERGWLAATGAAISPVAVAWYNQRSAAANDLLSLLENHLWPEAVQSQAGFDNALDSVAFYCFDIARLNSVLLAGYAKHVLHEAGVTNAVAEAFADGLFQIDTIERVRRPFLRMRCDVASGNVSYGPAFPRIGGNFLPVMTASTAALYTRAAIEVDVIALQVYTLKAAIVYARTSSEIDLVSEYTQCLQASMDRVMPVVAAVLEAPS